MYKGIVLTILILLISSLVYYYQCGLNLLPSVILGIILWFLTFYFYWPISIFESNTGTNLLLITLIFIMLMIMIYYMLGQLIVDKRE